MLLLSVKCIYLTLLGPRTPLLSVSDIGHVTHPPPPGSCNTPLCGDSVAGLAKESGHLAETLSIIQITIFAFKASQLVPYGLFHRGRSLPLRCASSILYSFNGT